MSDRSNDEFDFIVEVGSALGLWIGMSALGLYDFIQNFFSNAIRKANTFSFQ